MNIEYWKDRALTAEQKLREAQEQEPVGYKVVLHNTDPIQSYVGEIKSIHHGAENIPLYAAPIPPADVAELQRELKIQDDANEILERENAELTSKLAEQQAITKPLNIFYMIEVERAGWFVGRKDGQLIFTQHAEEAITFYDKHSAEVIMADYFEPNYMHPTTYGKAIVTEHAWCNGPNGQEELTKLLEEAKRQAVPEGLRKVSTERLPPEFEKVLHDNLWELYESSSAPKSEGVDK